MTEVRDSGADAAARASASASASPTPMDFVYLDYNATTPIDPEVAEEMKPFLFGSMGPEGTTQTQVFGNPSSSHVLGLRAKAAVETARQRVAKAINARDSSEIVFTSGGSESNNYALKGYILAQRDLILGPDSQRPNLGLRSDPRGRFNLVISAFEHPAVEEVAKDLEEHEGIETRRVRVDEQGILDLKHLEELISPQTLLVSIMHANNEVGTLQPLAAISAIIRDKNVAYGFSNEGARRIGFHSDAAQSFGKVKVDVQEFGVDLLTLVAHKFYGPKGSGVLYVKKGVKLRKLIHGAGHEQGHRAGTENTLHVVGIGKACEIATRDLEKNAKRCRETRDRLHEGLKKAFPNLKLNGHPELRLPNTLNVSFPKVEANTILAEIEDRVGASAGAACHSDTVDISPVLKAMKVPEEVAMGTIRFSTGKYTTNQDIDQALSVIVPVVRRLMPKKDNAVPKSGDEGESLDPSKVKLTHFTHGLGCACKLRPQALERVLSSLPPQFHNPNVLIGTETGDDAAVYKINEETALVSTLDFFTPIVDSPYHFGAIAAANSLSDVYAMGGQPLFALNIVGFPSNRLPLEVLTQILRGAQDKATEAGVSIVGGHTIDDLEPKYGMAVTGVVHPQKALSNRGGRPGDVLVLTKPIGTGIITTAIRRGVASKETEDRVIRVMSTLNKKAMEATHSLPSGSVHACTDVTGFGLLGHLRGMLPDDLDAVIHSDRVPILPEAREFCAQDIAPGGTKNNQLFLESHVRWDPSVTEVEKLLLCDAQTSGGILLALQPECLDSYLANCKALGLLDSEVAVIGSLQGNGSRTIRVLPQGTA